MPSQTSQPAHPVDTRSLPRVCLEVQQGSRLIAYEVGEVGFLIGSVPGCDLRVPGVDLPAVLALISRQPQEVEFRKLAPAQTILVNGRSANRAALQSGDQITLGNLTIRLSIEQVAEPLPRAQPAASTSSPQLRAARDELQQQMLNFRDQVVRFESERHLEQQRLQSRHEQLEKLAAELRQREQTPLPLRSGTIAPTAHGDLDERERALARRVAEITQKEHAVHARQAEFEQQKQEINSLRQQLADIRQQLYERYRERRDRLSGLQEAVNVAARKVQEQKRGLEAQLRACAAERDQHANREHDLAARENELAAQSNRLDRQRQTLEALAAELQQREESLQAQLTEVKENRQQYQDDLVLLSRLQVAFEQKEADFQKRATEFDQRMERLQVDSRDMEEQVNQIEAWRQRLQDEEKRLAEQKAEQDSIGSQLIQRAAAIEGQQATLATLRTRLERMRDDMRHEEQQLGEARARQEEQEQLLQHQAVELQRARCELDGEQQLREHEREQIIERSATLEAAVAQLRQAQEQFTRDQEQFTARHAELDALAEQLKTQQVELNEAQQKLEEERQTVRERTLTLAQAEQAREALQEQLRRRSDELAVRQQEFAEQIARFEEQTRALDQKRSTIEEQCQQKQQELEQLRQTFDLQSAELNSRNFEMREREETLERNVANLKEAGQRIAAERKALQEERELRNAALAEQERQRAEANSEFQAVIGRARELLQHLPELELRAGAALERLTHVREQLRDHLGEFHNYTRKCQDDLEELHARIQSDAGRLKQQEQALRRLQDEHRLEVAAFRQQLIDWQGQLTEKKRSLTHDESRIERAKAEVIQQVRQIDATSQTLARQAQELQEQERVVSDRRQEVDRHLGDMRKWYRKKLRELAGIEDVPGRSNGGTTLTGADDPPGSRNILTFPGADESDQKLGELLRSLELIDTDTLAALLVEARRQRRSLRQILLASGAVTLYQMAIIEAGEVDALMLGPVRVIDRLRVTNRETVYRVFDPRRGREAVLRYLAEEEMHDAVHPDEFRQRFAQACLAHPNVAATLEVLEIAGRPAALQEWVLGLPCADWPPLAAAPGVCLRLLKQAALGLHAIHQAGLVHGHLHENLLFLTPDGTLKVCGLGEPLWLAAQPPVQEASDARDDLLALGRITAEWSISGVRRGARTKPLPGELLTVLNQLAGSEGEGFVNTATVLAELERIQAKIPANQEAWDRLLKHIQEHAMPESVLRQSA